MSCTGASMIIIMDFLCTMMISSLGFYLFSQGQGTAL